MRISRHVCSRSTWMESVPGVAWAARAVFLLSVSIASAGLAQTMSIPDGTGEAAGAKAGLHVSLTIGSGQGSTDDQVGIPITLSTGGTGPAVISFALYYDPVKFAASGDPEAGPAAVAAGKEVSANEPTPGELRILVFNVGDDIIGDGELMTLFFQVLAPGNQHPVLLQGADASAAKPDGERIEALIDNNCNGPAAPETVAASQGRTDGVLIEWSAVDGAVGYEVLRSETNDAATAEPISGELSGMAEFLDESAEGPSTASAGCSGTTTSFTYYYYWVRAIGEVPCISDFGAAAQGYRGGSKMGSASASVLSSSRGDAAVLIALAGALGIAAFLKRAAKHAG